MILLLWVTALMNRANYAWQVKLNRSERFDSIVWLNKYRLLFKAAVTVTNTFCEVKILRKLLLQPYELCLFRGKSCLKLREHWNWNTFVKIQKTPFITVIIYWCGLYDFPQCAVVLSLCVKCLCTWIQLLHSHEAGLVCWMLWNLCDHLHTSPPARWNNDF